MYASLRVYLIVTHYRGWFLDCLLIIRVAWTNLQVTDTLAYFAALSDRVIRLNAVTLTSQ
jgi:hypothetical protein